MGTVSVNTPLGLFHWLCSRFIQLSNSHAPCSVKHVPSLQHAHAHLLDDCANDVLQPSCTCTLPAQMCTACASMNNVDIKC